MTRECRIGGLSWWAGLWWLALSEAALLASRAALAGSEGCMAAAWVCARACERWARLATDCAREGGAE